MLSSHTSQASHTSQGSHTAQASEPPQAQTPLADPGQDSWRDPVLRRVAIIGAGAMGCSLAALIAPHIETLIVVRDAARAARIEAGGIALQGAIEGVGRPRVVRAIRDLAAIHPIDLVFIATKTTAIPAVCAEMEPDLLQLPYLVSYQNGIEPGREIIRRLGTPRVIRMVLHYGAHLGGAHLDEPGLDETHEGCAGDAPLRVQVNFHAPPHFAGGEGAAEQAFARGLARRLSEIGLPTQFAADIDVEVWRKGLLNAATNPVAALTREPVNGLLHGPARPLVERLLDEGLAVADAAGIGLGGDARARALAALEAAADHLPSMAEDVIAGRSTEITQLNVQIAARGAALGVATPTHNTIVELIRAIDAGLG